MNFRKYQKYPMVPRTSRKWPERQIEQAPVWCSVDLRDGNQALEIPMDLDQKLAFFGFLVETNSPVSGSRLPSNRLFERGCFSSLSQ